MTEKVIEGGTKIRVKENNLITYKFQQKITRKLSKFIKKSVLKKLGGTRIEELREFKI